MAGSWEPLVFRVRRDGTSYVPTPEQRAGWEREHSPAMVARLKELGVNFLTYRKGPYEPVEESKFRLVTIKRQGRQVRYLLGQAQPLESLGGI